MERVVDGAVAVGLLVPRAERVLHAAAGVLHGEVDDRRDAAPRRGAGAGLERVGRLGAAERHLHVGVHVDAARHDVLAGGVDRAVGGDAQRVGLPGGEDGDDRLAVDEHVGRRARPTAETTVPPEIRVVLIGSPLDELAVGVGAAVAVERPAGRGPP